MRINELVGPNGGQQQQQQQAQGGEQQQQHQQQQGQPSSPDHERHRSSADTDMLSQLDRKSV